MAVFLAYLNITLIGLVYRDQQDSVRHSDRYHSQSWDDRTEIRKCIRRAIIPKGATWCICENHVGFLTSVGNFDQSFSLEPRHVTQTHNFCPPWCEIIVPLSRSRNSLACQGISFHAFHLLMRNTEAEFVHTAMSHWRSQRKLLSVGVVPFYLSIFHWHDSQKPWHPL